MLGGETGTSTASLDVGAAVGTDVYSPVDGTIVGISPLTLRGQTFGSRIDIQPTSAPALVVRVTHLRPGSGADRRLVGRGVDLEDRHDHRLLARRAAGACAVHAGRGQPRVVRGPPRGHARDTLKILFIAE
jgi:hypothetical protein